MINAFDWTNDRMLEDTNGVYRKKPVDIVAFRLLTLDFLPMWFFEREDWNATDNNAILIKTLEGTMRADVGDWIIRGVNGEIYPCKHEIFCKTYDLVELQPNVTEGE